MHHHHHLKWRPASASPIVMTPALQFTSWNWNPQENFTFYLLWAWMIMQCNACLSRGRGASTLYVAPPPRSSPNCSFPAAAAQSSRLKWRLCPWWRCWMHFPPEEESPAIFSQTFLDGKEEGEIWNFFFVRSFVRSLARLCHVHFPLLHSNFWTSHVQVKFCPTFALVSNK